MFGTNLRILQVIKLMFISYYFKIPKETHFFNLSKKMFLALLLHLNLSIIVSKCKLVFDDFHKAFIYFPDEITNYHKITYWKLVSLSTGLLLHDLLYQLLRIFYISRFKPDNLQMTLSQWAMPIFDVVFLINPILQIKRFCLILYSIHNN